MTEEKKDLQPTAHNDLADALDDLYENQSNKGSSEGGNEEVKNGPGLNTFLSVSHK
jgi:hypothetical protein